MTLADILKRAQGSKTIQEFADELGLSPAMLSLLHNGERGPGLKTISALLNHPDTRQDMLIFLSQNVTSEG